MIAIMSMVRQGLLNRKCSIPERDAVPENPELKKFAADELAEVLRQEQTARSLPEKLKPSAGKFSPPHDHPLEGLVVVV